MSNHYVSTCIEDTSNWALSNIKYLQAGEVIGFVGQLGAGKTTLIQSIAKHFKYNKPVTSPSYSLINEYNTTPTIIHMDLYRMDEKADWEEIGLEYYFTANNLCLVEWPERLKDTSFYPTKFIHINLLPNQHREISWLH